MLLSVSALFQFLTFLCTLNIWRYALPLVKAWKNGATNPTDSSTFSVHLIKCCYVPAQESELEAWIPESLILSEYLKQIPQIGIDTFFFFLLLLHPTMSKEYAESYHVSPPPLLPSWSNS